jgi:hypothetical protein
VLWSMKTKKGYTVLKECKADRLAGSGGARSESQERGDIRHTPGPWTMRPDGVILAESRTERKAIGQFFGMASEQQHVDEHAGNCRLIAATPELLEALKEVPAWFEEWNVEIGAAEETLLGRVNAAIAKATR